MGTRRPAVGVAWWWGIPEGKRRSETTAVGHGLSILCGSNEAAGLWSAVSQPRAGAAYPELR